MRMPDDRDVLTPDTALIIRIANLVPARHVTEGKGEVAPLPQFIMDLPAEHAADVSVDSTGMKVREQRMVLQRYDEHVLHVGFDGSGRCPRNPHPLYRDSVLVLPYRQALRSRCPSGKGVCPVPRVSARRCAKVIPFVEPVIDLERRVRSLRSGDKYQYCFDVTLWGGSRDWQDSPRYAVVLLPLWSCHFLFTCFQKRFTLVFLLYIPGPK